jgi:hypothetical protein
MPFTLGEELRNGGRIGRPRVPVPYRGRKEFYEAPGGSFTRASDRGRQSLKSSARKIP